MKKLIYKQRGGARRGFMNITWPFEHLSVYEDRLVLSKTTLLKGNIKKLSKHRGIFSTGFEDTQEKH